LRIIIKKVKALGVILTELIMYVFYLPYAIQMTLYENICYLFAYVNTIY
jgi:hypothetical protein